MLKRKLEPIPDSELIIVRLPGGHGLFATHIDDFIDEDCPRCGEIYQSLKRGESVEIGIEEYRWSRL